MKDYIEERTIEEGEYILKFNSTVRGTAKMFSVGKSTVHKDLTERLNHIDKRLYVKVKKLLDKNAKERHIRGGNATKLKYIQLKNKNKQNKVD